MKVNLASLNMLIASAFFIILISKGFGQETESSQQQKDEPKTAQEPKVISVTGEVVDLWCYLDRGAKGEAHRDCAMTCAKAGNPIGILDDKGKVYLLLGAEMHSSGESMLVEHMAHQVTVKGAEKASGGIDAIYVSSVTPVSGATTSEAATPKATPRISIVVTPQPKMVLGKTPKPVVVTPRPTSPARRTAPRATPR